jgi:predicted ATPase
MNIKPYLREIQYLREQVVTKDEYPFNISALKGFQSLEFHQDVTFIVGENGAGKSTLIEAIALCLGLGAEGGTKNVQFSTHDNISGLSSYLKLIRGYKMPDDYYFLRAESFYNVATYMEQTNYLKGYGGSPHLRSHGEAFLAVLTKKLQGRGLYIFDEPEAALSANRQMTALTAIDNLVKKRSQLIIATHSPILLSYPNSVIYMLDDDGIRKTSYEQTPHYQITKGFLNDYERMLDILLDR